MVNSIQSNSIEEGIAVQTVPATANGAILVGQPVGLYLGTNGMNYATLCALDDASVRYGIALESVATGESVKIAVKGKVKVVSGGTEGNLVTAISTGGGLTSSAAPGATNADINVLGMCTGTGELILY